MARHKTYKVSADTLCVALVSRLRKGLPGELRVASPAELHLAPCYTDTAAPRVEEDSLRAAETAGMLHSNCGRYMLTALGVQLGLQGGTLPAIPFEDMVDRVRHTVFCLPSKKLGGRTAVPLSYISGADNSRLLLVLGDNATGKSLIRRLMKEVATRPTTDNLAFQVAEFMHISMQARTGEWASMVFGSETTSSTGTNSATSVGLLLSSVPNRGHTVLVWLDEPDIGCSAGVAAGIGVRIRRFVETSESTLARATVVTSHAPALIRQLLPLQPSVLFVGDTAYGSLDAWLTAQENPEPVDIAQLHERAHARFRDIQTVLTDLEEE